MKIRFQTLKNTAHLRASLAQLVLEHSAFNRRVTGSNPVRGYSLRELVGSLVLLVEELV